MIKVIFRILLVVLFLGVAACEPQKSETGYPSGRDTIASYGDGTFQLVGGNGDKELYNEKYNISVAGEVRYIQATAEKVYAIGSGAQGRNNTIERRFTLYVVVTLSDNRMQFYISPEEPSMSEVNTGWLEEMMANGDAQRIYAFTDFSDKDQAVFNEMLRSDNGD